MQRRNSQASGRNGEAKAGSKNGDSKGRQPGERPRAGSLGPVPDLEQYVVPDWWRNIFNSLYLKTDADVVEDRRITADEVDLFSQLLGLAPDSRILDLCCGQGRHSLELARRGFAQVEGLDRSHYLIQKAKGRARREGLAVRFREGDARKLPYEPDTFDAVLLLGNSFGYFETLKDDLQVLRGVFKALKPWGRLLIDITDGEYLKERYQPRSWEWLDDKHFACRERTLSVDGQRLITREVITRIDRGVIADQFYAERLYTREGVARLLEEAGFSSVSFHGSLATESQRKQDLGMMSRRILVSAQARKEWTPTLKRALMPSRTVVVLLGDPSKPDPLKPLRVFDEDDFYTIDCMKAALKEIRDHEFIYLSDHDTLLHELGKLVGRVDYAFNLCDEGLNNDPRRELHVPALLEQLGILYTGSGPQCLAHCYDKSLVRGISREMGIPVPEAFLIKPEDSTFELPFDFPVIVKPNFGDSSFGITSRSVAADLEQLLNAISEIRQRFGYERPILVEEFLGGKDLTVGIIGNPPSSYTVLPLAEEDYSALPPELPRICGYEAKWCPESPYWNIKSVPAALPDNLEKALVGWCLQLFERLACRDYARFDWRLSAAGRPKLLEVNPNPGWCWDGHLAKMAAMANMSYSQMLVAILQAAEERFRMRQTAEKAAEPQAAKPLSTLPASH